MKIPPTPAAVFLSALFLGLAPSVAETDPPCSLPELGRAVAAEYPFVARKARLQATYDIELELAADGSVVSASQVGGPELPAAFQMAERSLGAARQWVFRPLGEGDCTRVTVQFVFELVPFVTPQETPLYSFEAPLTMTTKARAPRLD